jgi:membrane protein required for colicin V production
MGISLIFDLFVVLILLVSAGVSFFRGFIREVLTIFGFVGGAMAAFFAGGIVSDFIKTQFNLTGDDVGKLFGLIPYDMVASIASYGGIFIAVFLSLQLASHFISSAAKAIGLGPVDRTLGVFFGLARGVLLLAILYLPFNLILPDENKEAWFGSSKTHVFLESGSNWLAEFLPKSDETTKDDTSPKEPAKDVTMPQPENDPTQDKIKQIIEGQ